MRKQVYYFYLACITILSSCSNAVGPSIPEEPLVEDTLTTGIIVGKVFDGNDNSIPLVGVRVTIDSLPYETYTDSSGIYHLQAPTSKWHIATFFKEGYGTVKLFHQPFAAPGKAFWPNVYMSVKPCYKVIGITSTTTSVRVATPAAIIDTTTTYLKGKLKLISPEAHRGNAVLFRFYKVNPKVYPTAIGILVNPSKNRLFQDSTGKQIVEAAFMHHELYQSHFWKGEVIYLTMQLLNHPGPQSGAGYYNPITQAYEYVAVGPESEPVKVVLE